MLKTGNAEIISKPQILLEKHADPQLPGALRNSKVLLHVYRSPFRTSARRAAILTEVRVARFT
jgi:hypothetical protein